MIVMFTDFGPGGPYTGQMKAVLAARAPGVPVVELMDDAPRQNPKAAAYLLAALAPAFPADAVFLAVVDPGVGGARPPAAVKAGQQWFVGPANGLMEIVLRRAEAAGRDAATYEITWRPERLSASFHGRDLFAPVAARLALAEPVLGEEVQGRPGLGEARPAEWMRNPDWPDDLAEIVYIDGFGNAITGMRSSRVDPSFELRIASKYVKNARTFSDTPLGGVFWYVNSNDLVEVAVNQGHAGEQLGLEVGTPVTVNA